MPQSVCITHPQLHPVSLMPDTSKGKALVQDQKFQAWESGPENHPVILPVALDLGKPRSFNCIELEKHPQHPQLFPNQFSFEISDDGRIWESILHEIDFKESTNYQGHWNFSLVKARYVRLVCHLSHNRKGGKYQAAVGPLRISVSGVEKIDVSSQLDRLWVKENLFDTRPDYGWSSTLGSKTSEEYFLIDLGSVNRVDEIRLLTKNDPQPHFPENFIILGSEDDITWHTVLEETHFMAQGGNWYRWRFPARNLRYVKFVSKQGARTTEGRYVAQIVEFEMYARPEVLDSGGPGIGGASSLPYASVLHSGLVRFARDGEINESVAVQGNDRRLKESTTQSKGIVELATDGEDREGVVVQGNDRRLKRADGDNFGIVRLCPDGEAKEGYVVQGQDQRLKPATTRDAGIVELAEDGESRPGVAVQGHDKRLKLGNENHAGLVQLAADGDVSPSRAVQGNDKRLRDATVAARGIMRFAENGEESSLAAVQGNDKRLKPASTVARGIVELAENGEKEAGKVVQGNDVRLEPAGPKKPGIVEICPPGSERPGAVVTGDDPRLSDSREPLPHEHDYAPRKHDWSTHTGRIDLRGNQDGEEKGLVKPSQESGLVRFQNEGKDSAVTMVGERLGQISHGRKAGAKITGNETGLVAAGRDGHGILVTSEKDFALKIPGREILDWKLGASGQALWAEGESVFEGSVRINNGGQGCVAIWLPVDNKDVLSNGDVVIAKESNGADPLLSKCKTNGDSRVVGIVVKKAGLQLGKKEDKKALVAVSGLVYANCEARTGSIRPGELLVTGKREGHLRAFDAKNDNPRLVCGRALGELRSGEGRVAIIIHP